MENLLPHKEGIKNLHLIICFFFIHYLNTHTHTHTHTQTELSNSYHLPQCLPLLCPGNPVSGKESASIIRTMHLVCGTCSIDIVIILPLFSFPPSFFAFPDPLLYKKFLLSTIIHFSHHPTLSSNLFSSLHLLFHTFPVHRPTGRT